ncbi:MAG: inner membrane CreD family protein, partial [Thiothrix sp.]
MSEQIIPPPVRPQRTHSSAQRLGWRVFTVSLLVLLMLLPLLVIRNIVAERSTHYANALAQVTNAWGKRQTVVGPVLVIPYVEHFTNVDTVTEPNGESRVVSKDIFNDRTAILLPEQLEIRADLQTEQQRDGIYTALVYNAKLSINGRFDHSPILQATENDRRIAWDKAYIAIGLDDTRALDTASSLFWNEGRIDLQPGTRLNKLLPNGFHVPLMMNADSNTSNAFKLTLSLRGSDGLLFAPVGENTAIRISSPWTTPRFIGELSP